LFRQWIKRYFNLYDIEDLRMGGICGCCGVWMPDRIVPKDWPYDLCKKCYKGGNNSESSLKTICFSYGRKVKD